MIERIIIYQNKGGIFMLVSRKTYNDIDVNLDSTYVCQMKLFAMIRKSQPERRSYKLSSMYKDIVGIDKLSSSENG